VNATRVGVIKTRANDRATCWRCGLTNKVNKKRGDLRGYLCRSCKDVLKLMEQEAG
jgi:transposase-like protein